MISFLSKRVRPAGPALEQAAAGWTHRLTFFVSLGLIVEVITGFWILVAPFSTLAQLQVLLHTAAGLLLVGPFAVYQLRHWLTWRSQTLSVVMLIGYAGMVVTLACLASGLVVFAQAAFGRRVTPLWDQLHTASAIAVVAFIVLHVGFAYARRREALRKLPEFTRRLRRGLTLLGLGTAAASVAASLTAVLVPTVPTTLPTPEGYTLPEFAQQFDEYRGSPFAPTYARTSTGGMINPAVLANSASCGTVGCHEEIVDEWEPSAHRFSAMNPPFQAVQKNFTHDRGAPETRYCAGCHDPISLFAGAKDVSNVHLSAPGMQEGSSCVVCHAISEVDQRGNADYVLTPPQRYLGETSGGLPKVVSDFLIRAYPRQHLADYNRPVLRTAEFCGACHKQFIPEALNHFGATPAQNQFDEWRKSHWAKPQDPANELSCRDCHMRLVDGSADPASGQPGDVRRTARDGKHRHHGFIGTNAFMSELLKLPHHEKHVRLTEEWMKGETVIPEIAHLLPTGPAASVELVAPKTAEPGQSLVVDAIVRNRKAGHAFSTGPLDFIRAWIHLRVVDGSGKVLAEWGGIDPETRDILDEPGQLHELSKTRRKGTLVLESVPLDAQGRIIVRHDLWRKAGGSDLRVVFPGYADKQTYTCQIPAAARGPITVTADLNFRRYRQEFLNLVLPDMEKAAGVYQRTTVTDSAAAVVELGSPEPPIALSTAPVTTSVVSSP